MQLDIGRRQYLNFAATTAVGADMGTWSGILRRHWRDIDWQFWPKVLAVSCFVLIMSPIIWVERLIYGRRIREQKVTGPVFIIGHQRSGTTYLNYLLARDPRFGVLTVKEGFMPWVSIVCAPMLRWMLRKAMPDRRPMDNLALGMELPTEPEYALGNMTAATMVPGYNFPRVMLKVLRDNVLMEDDTARERWKATLWYFMQKLTMINGGRPLLLKSPENLARVKEILEVLPDARFIHIRRDPVTVYFSTEKLYEVTLPMVALQHCQGKVVQEFIMESYPAMFRKFFADRRLIPPGQLAEIRYEDLIGNEMEVLRQVYAQLGLDGYAQVAPHILSEVKAHADYRRNRYEYPTERVNDIRDRWADVIRELGY